jgi:quercetin dioxygenase-like cupin family protein
VAVQKRVIVNSSSGERIVVRTSGEETGGALLVFDLFLPPGTHVPATHVHPSQTERFAVVGGRMRFELGGRSVVAGPGEVVEVPPGAAHWFGNAGIGVAHARVEVRPALRMEEMLEWSGAMRPLAHFLGLTVPRPIDLLLLLLEFRREIAAPHVPAFLVNALLRPLAVLARRRTARPVA